MNFCQLLHRLVAGPPVLVITAVLVLALAPADPVLGDTVTLRNGVTLRGKIIKVSTGRHLIIRVGGRIRRIPLRDIRSLRKSPRRPVRKVKRTPAKPKKKAPPTIATPVQPAKPAPLPTMLRWVPGYYQYKEGRKLRGAALGTVFAASLASTFYNSARLASIRRAAAGDTAYNLGLDREIDNRFRRVRERLDWSRVILLFSALGHGYDLLRSKDPAPAKVFFAPQPARSTTLDLNPRATDASYYFGFRFHF